MIRPFAYVKPATMEEALDALKLDNSKPLAGGTDLLVEMRNGLKEPELLVDIKCLAELNTLTNDREGGVKIGAGVTLNALIENKEIRERLPAIAEAAFSIATYQLRNRATMVGNICNASPAADMAPPLYVLGADVVITGPCGERIIPISEFITGVKKNSLKKGELVVQVEVPQVPKAKMVFLKKQRIKGHDLALINVAGLADKQSGSLRICVGACAVKPLLLEGLDQAFQETKGVEQLAEQVARLALQAISPIDDVRSSKEYRMDMVEVLVKRVVRQICD